MCRNDSKLIGDGDLHMHNSINIPTACLAERNAYGKLGALNTADLIFGKDYVAGGVGLYAALRRLMTEVALQAQAIPNACPKATNGTRC